MRIILSILLTVLILWCIGLIWFVCTLPHTVTSSKIQTDAIVVLTGGEGRVERGIEMFAEGAAPFLFVSGVGNQVTLMEMLAIHALPETRIAARRMMRERGASILLGQTASSTQTNAKEVADFVREHSVNSIRLVTAHYHMARSLLEFRHALPQVELVPDPVYPTGFRHGEWWQYGHTRRLLLSEYHKYVATRFRMMVQ